ncbi:MAG: UDP-N-acetylglucosamine 2-epimerase (non-hydrolyzing) [Bacteroidales bacterium]
MKVVNIVGARPNFIKIAPLMHAMARSKELEPILLHTGQHYDYNMSESFFNELSIPKPDVYLEVGSAPHGKQVAMIMKKFDAFCEAHQPDLVVVVGDVNSTMACSLVAVKRHIKVAHIEAGIRSYDRSMPEEVNRIVTDSIADLLLPPSMDAVENLYKEGHTKDQIHLVGNIMIDTLLKNQPMIQASDILNKLQTEPKGFALLTLHRPSNVDNSQNFGQIMDALEAIQKRIQIVFPIHPRTKKRMEEFGLLEKVNQFKNIILTEPLGYFDFGKLVHDAKFVLTDSGGIQEETTVYKVPCITLRENTERPITISVGTNELAGSDKQKIIDFAYQILDGNWKQGKIPELWDGNTAERIVRIFENLQL